jgi:hypothetical protein
LIPRYKTHEESRAERRSYYADKEVSVPISMPQAPPRTKRAKETARRQSFKEFRAEHSKSSSNNRRTLFQSDHRTEEGVDLLPVGKKIAFDCPDDGANISEIYVGIKGKQFNACCITLCPVSICMKNVTSRRQPSRLESSFSTESLAFLLS